MTYRVLGRHDRKDCRKELDRLGVKFGHEVAPGRVRIRGTVMKYRKELRYGA